MFAINKAEMFFSRQGGYFENRANELGELIRDLGLESVHMCGMWEGGTVALVFASSLPEEAKHYVWSRS